MSFALAMDILIALLLAATIFYAVRLSKHLDAFRSNRADMERLIRDLSSQITRAQEGITTLDDVARESSADLRKLVDRAMGLSDELQIITESGDKLAERLENLATRNREISDHMSQTSVKLTYPGGKAPVLTAEKKQVDQAPPAPAKSFFSIRDPDFSDEDGAQDHDDNDGLQSQSEKLLAAVLRRKNKSETK